VSLRRALVSLVAALGVVALCVPAAGAVGASSFHLQPTGGTSFPDRAYVLTLPSAAYISPDSVVVRENGKVVKGITVVPANATQAGEFGVVLVIDATLTMKSPAIDDAMAAARAFATRRNPNQQLALITFNRTIKDVLPFTTNDQAIRSALAPIPHLSCCTPLYDAVDRGISLIENAGISVGSVVLLSDGAENASVKTADQVIAHAQDDKVRIFTVGLRSPRFRPETLQELSAKTGGQYSNANSSGQLAQIFDQLGARLASEYLIRYKSNAPADKKVFVTVTVEGYPGAATTAYESPSVSATGEAPFNRSEAEIFVRSTAGMVVTAVVAALLVAAALHFLIRPRTRGVKSRLAEFVSLPFAKPKVNDPQEKRDPLFDRAEQSFGGTQWWARFKLDLEIGRVNIPATRILFWTLAATLVAAYLLSLIDPLLLFAAFAIPLSVRGVVKHRAWRQRQLFAEQLPDNLQVLASALRAGHSLVGALSVVVDDSPEPSKSEFKRVIADEQLGVPLEDAIEVVAQRMESKDLSQVGLVAALQRDTGGNTAEVLDRVAETVRERFELRRLVRTLTAQGRMSRWILTSLPVFLLVVITLLNPDYIQPLYHNPGGRVVLFVAALMVVAGSLVIRKIIDIKV
jgi:tight adherence protein B